MRGAEKEDTEYTDAEWKEILSDATICTEATRADTVDRCVKSQYISLKKGVYYGEPAGFQLVDIMDKLGIVLDVPVTVNLSKQLHSIKDGNLTRVQVLEYTKQTLESIMSKDVTIAAAQGASSKYPVLCQCPKCGKDVVETKLAYACTGKDSDGKRCPVTIWKKNKFLEALGKEMTKTTAKALLTKGKAPLKGCISAKTGKKYDSILTCDFSGDRLAYHIEFDKSSMSFGSKVGKCPFCGKPVAETAKAFTCTNKSCGAALWKESKLYGNELDVDADIAKTLLSGKTVEATIQNKERTGTQDVEVGIEPYTAPNGRKYIGLCIMKTK